jgi:hypothetical protein
MSLAKLSLMVVVLLLANLLMVVVSSVDTSDPSA